MKYSVKLGKQVDLRLEGFEETPCFVNGALVNLIIGDEFHRRLSPIKIFAASAKMTHTVQIMN